MSESINNLILNAKEYDTVLLPSGEFEGPVYISKPVRLRGNNTTLWQRNGSVIEVTCKGAIIENIRAELTEAANTETAIIAHETTEINEVEVYGTVKGFGDEDGYFDIPKCVKLYNIAAEKRNTFLLKLSVPVECSIECEASGIEFYPSKLQKGENIVTLVVQNQSAGTLLYAQALIKSEFNRRIYISGNSVQDAEPAQDKEIFHCGETIEKSDVLSTLTKAPNEEISAVDMRKGQRLSMNTYTDGCCEILFSYDTRNAEIDPYVFILDSNAKAFGSTGMVFFGFEKSEDGAIAYNSDNNNITIDFDKLDYRIDRILVCYSIYEDSEVKSFSEVKNPCCRIYSNGKKRINYDIYGLSDCDTVIALELYKYKGEWKASAIGRPFRSGLAALCESFDIQVE